MFANTVLSYYTFKTPEPLTDFTCYTSLLHNRPQSERITIFLLTYTIPAITKECLIRSVVFAGQQSSLVRVWEVLFLLDPNNFFVATVIDLCATNVIIYRGSNCLTVLF